MNILKEMQEVELNILIEIDKICRKNNIKYTLIAGSLLGAIRHKGFIPWDDDIDIGMTLDNYHKFLRVAKYELPKHLLIENPFTFKDCVHHFTKIVDSNTTLIVNSTKLLDNAKGLGLDIFPIYGMPKNKVFFSKIKAIWCNFLVSNHLFNIEYKKLKYTRKILSFFTKHKKIQKTWLSYIKYMEKNDCKGHEVTFADWMEGSKKYDYKIFDNYIDTSFEGYKFMIIKEYNYYLENTYGDFMTPPSMDKRVSNHTFDYWNRNMPYKIYLLNKNKKTDQLL